MSAQKFRSRSVSVLLAAAAALNAGAASAISFQIGENTLQIDNLLTIGASWRMEERDGSLVGKANLIDGLCYVRTTGTPESGPSPYPEATASGAVNSYDPGLVAAGCGTSDSAAIQDYINNYPGSNNPNSDQGNLNFDKGDIVHAVAKLTSDISFSIADYNFFVRPIYYFDANYTRFEEQHEVTTLQPARSQLPGAVERQVGSNLDVLDYSVSTSFDVFDRTLSLKVGNQVLNWGESSLLVFNSINTVNPLDATKLRLPGADLKEFFQPVGMVVAGFDVIESVSLEGFYQYDWKPLIVDPVGTFFSQSDTLGAGGRYAMLSQGRVPDDPGFATDDPRYARTGMRGYFRGIDTCTTASCFDSAGTLGSTSSRTVFRDYNEERARRPDDGGQYGGKLGFFFEEFNNGTEVALYYANYHSRYPIVSFRAADATCLIGGDALGSLTACGITPTTGLDADNAATPENEEPLPVDTATLFVEYPENIRMYGLSFNTTVGDFAISGEYAYRPNIPVQVHTTDLTFAALQPAFPSTDVPLGVATIPGRRGAAPDFVSRYRDPDCNLASDGADRCVAPGQYIRGYERLELGNASLTFLRLIGGDNPIGASQMTMLLELGMAQVFDMPSLRELQFNGGGADVHISDGADGTTGINPPGSSTNAATHQNVTAQKDLTAFGAAESYGYRLLNLNRWESALFGANLETLAIIQHDVKGTTPGVGTNFTDGRKQFAFGIRFDYLSTYLGEVRYSWNTGGGNRDYLHDRDNIQVSLGVQF